MFHNIFAFLDKLDHSTQKTNVEISTKFKIHNYQQSLFLIYHIYWVSEYRWKTLSACWTVGAEYHPALWTLVSHNLTLKMPRFWIFIFFNIFTFLLISYFLLSVRTCMLCRQNGRQTQHQQPIMQRSVAMQTARPLSTVSVLVSTSRLQWGHCKWQALTQTVQVTDKSLTLTLICFIDTHRHLQ